MVAILYSSRLTTCVRQKAGNNLLSSIPLLRFSPCSNQTSRITYRHILEANMKRQPPVTLRLITDQNATIDLHCTLCQFLHLGPEECTHNLYEKEYLRTQSHISDFSFYTAHTTESNAPVNTGRIKAQIITTPPAHKRPTLRHKTSPTETSLRELRAQHAQQLLVREKQSEQRLQDVYESQILSYLDSPLAERGIPSRSTSTTLRTAA